MEGIKKELMRMMEMARNNVLEAFDIFKKRKKEKYEVIEKREEYVDFLNKEISKYITSAISFEGTSAGSQIFNSLFSIAGNIERMSDHAMNIAGYSNTLVEKNVVFSEQADCEFDEMKSTRFILFSLLLEKPDDYVKWHEKVACLEQKIDDMTVQFKITMYDRIQSGQCSDESGILFSEMLTDFEHIGDHALNISNEMLNMAMILK